MIVNSTNSTKLDLQCRVRHKKVRQLLRPMCFFFLSFSLSFLFLTTTYSL